MLKLSASRVSCRQATSTFSRESSLSITAVLRALSTCCRSAVNAGHKVLTFQLAKRRAGVFFLRVFFPGAEEVARLLRELYKLHAPSEAGRPWRDSTLLAGGCPAWAGGSCPMRYNDLSHRQKWPLALVSYANQMSLSPVTATSRVMSTPFGIAGVSSPVEPQGLGRIIWRISCCPCSRFPHLHAAGVSKGRTEVDTARHQERRRSCQNYTE